MNKYMVNFYIRKKMQYLIGPNGIISGNLLLYTHNILYYFSINGNCNFSFSILYLSTSLSVSVYLTLSYTLSYFFEIMCEASLQPSWRTALPLPHFLLARKSVDYSNTDQQLIYSIQRVHSILYSIFYQQILDREEGNISSSSSSS